MPSSVFSIRLNTLPFTATQTIENLVVKDESGVEIKGLGNQISGMDFEGFEITLVGVPYPFFEEKFPHHVQAYENQFK